MEILMNPHKNDNVLKYMTKFKRDSTQKYTLITPDTQLYELEQFLKENSFAIGLC